MKYYVDGCSFACDWEDHISWSHHFKDKIVNAYSGKSNISIFHDTYKAMENRVADCYLIMFTYSERQEVETDRDSRDAFFGSHVINKDGSYNNNYLYTTRKNTERYIKCLNDYALKHDLNFKYITVEPPYCFDDMPEENWFNGHMEMDKEKHSWFLHNLITIYGADNMDMRENFAHLGNDANFSLFNDINYWLTTGIPPVIEYSKDRAIWYLKNKIDDYNFKEEQSRFLGGVINKVIKTGFIYES